MPLAFGPGKGDKEPTPKEPWPDAEPESGEKGRYRAARHQRFRSLGIGGPVLDVLTASEVSMHDVEVLVRRGCPAETAARILL